MGKRVWSARFLIEQLFKRDFLAAYKKSFLGIAWIFISPLTGIIAWVFLQKVGMLNPGELDVPYPAYVLVGTMCWEYFAGSLNSATRTLGAGKSLVMQVNYPHEAMLIKEVLQFLAHFTLKLILILIILTLFGVIPSWKTIFLPFYGLPLILLGSGIGLFLSLFVVISADVMKIVGMGMKLLMWSTPIIYSAKASNETLRLINEYNPLTYGVCTMRDIILYGRVYGDYQFYYLLAASFIVFFISLRIFYTTEQQLVEKIW